MKDLGKHALWIYGTVIGLAIKEAITAVFSHVRNESTYEEVLIGVRFVLFILVASRFYLGAAYYFEEVHGASSTIPEAKRQFGLDFLLGLLHFLFFFGWAGNLTNHSVMTFGFTAPLLIVLGILVYDLVWLFVSANLETRNIIAQWAGLNLLFVLIALLGFATVGAAYYV